MLDNIPWRTIISTLVSQLLLYSLKLGDLCVWYCLVPRPHYSFSANSFRVTSSERQVRPFLARTPRIRLRSEVTEKAWENAVQGLGNVWFWLTTPNCNNIFFLNRKENRKKLNRDKLGTPTTSKDLVCWENEVQKVFTIANDKEKFSYVLLSQLMSIF